VSRLGGDSGVYLHIRLVAVLVGFLVDIDIRITYPATMRFFLSLAAGALAFGAASAATVSTDGSCGGASKYTCAGSSFGNCCSQVRIYALFFLWSNTMLTCLVGLVRFFRRPLQDWM
jgi:hypothetical protein